MGDENHSTVTGSSKTNFLDEKVFFLHVAIVLTCFQSENSQNKLDFMHSFLLKRFIKLVKMNFKKEQREKSHASVILNSHFAWILTKVLFSILSRLFASKLLRKAWKLPRKHTIMNELSVQIQNRKLMHRWILLAENRWLHIAQQNRIILKVLINWF